MSVEPRQNWKHGVSAYKRGLCRCVRCTRANTNYERKRRAAGKVRAVPRIRHEFDTFTRDEIMNFRARMED